MHEIVATLAAHYGSVSAVAFAAVQTFRDALGVPYEGFMPTLVAILEVPAIIIALWSVYACTYE